MNEGLYAEFNRLKHSERIKSELIIGSKMLSALRGIKDCELEGAIKMLEHYFNALLTEVGIALNSTKDFRFKEVIDLISNLDLRNYEESMQKVSKAVSLTTTCAIEAFQTLFGDKTQR